jgi:lipopolysaccharide biosynthesis protein
MEQSGGQRGEVRPLRPQGAPVQGVAASDTAPRPHASRPQALIVAGMHRSGTSALTGALTLCGLQAPRILMEGNAFNEDGYWESEAIKASNDSVLHAMDSSWDDVLASRPMRIGRYGRATIDTLKRTLTEEFDTTQDLVVKDPRISVLFRPWRDAIDELGLTPKLVVMVRHPLEVASSLRARDGFPAAKSALLWLSHIIAIERDSRDTPRVFISYEALLSNWRACFARMERTLGLRLPHWTDEVEFKIDGFLSADRRHHVFDAAALSERSDLPQWIARAYEWGLDAADGGEPDPSALQEIADEFHSGANVFAPIVTHERRRPAPPVAPFLSGCDFVFCVYSASKHQPFSDDTAVRLSARLTQEPQIFSIVTPAREAPLTELRLDPAEENGRLLLHALRVRAPEGRLLWEWAGEQDLFRPEMGVHAEPLSQSCALLEFLNTDPQIALPLSDQLGGLSQVIIEIVASVPDGANIAAARIAGQLASAVSEVELRLELSLRESLAPLDDSLGVLSSRIQQTTATGEDQLAQTAAFLERRLHALGDDVAALIQTSAQAYETALVQMRNDLTDRLIKLETQADEYSTLVGHAANVARERDEALAEIARIKEAHSTLVRHATDVAQERDEALRDADQRKQEIGRIKEAHSTLVGHATDVARERDEALADVDLRKQEIAQIKASTSWRVTAPMRTVKRGPSNWLHSARGAARRARNAFRKRFFPKSYAANPLVNDGPDLEQLLRRSSLFDPDWYLATYPDVDGAGRDPLAHYLHQGAFEGRAPGPAFDSRWYLVQNPDVAAARINPLAHYLMAGRREGRAPRPSEPVRRLADYMRLLRHRRHWRFVAASAALVIEGALPRKVARRLRASTLRSAPPTNTHDAQTGASAIALKQIFEAASARSGEYVPLSPTPTATPSRIRTIAFYLPQFHPIPENDAWWGKGFTEWTNVSKAAPQFVDHYQPRLPDELGYYDLRVPEVQRRQVELAKHYGIYGFCFHYYWFTGRKRLLERPLNQFVADRALDFPFCICWANENWTRRWDGLDQEILMEQRHEPQDDLQFIEDLEPLLRDPCYIRVDGRPLIIVYRVDILPRPLQTVQVWRDYCRSRGLGEPYLVAAQSFGTRDPRPFGFDAAVEFPPHNDYRAEEITREQTLLNPASEGRVYSYEKVAQREASKSFPDYTLFRGVMPGWDNEARKPGKGFAFAGSTPKLYASWLRALARATDRRHANDGEKLIFINAWNEWAEGAYLEPDRRFGYAFLQATKDVLSAFPADGQRREQPPLHVVVHAYYPDILEEMLGRLRRVDRPFSLTVTTPSERAAAVQAAFARADLSCPFQLIEVENRGRDVLAFLEVLRRTPMTDDTIILKVHTKKSAHREDGSDWRREMLGCLMADDVIEQTLDAFAADPALGLVAPAKYLAPITTYIGYNQARIEALLRRAGWSSLDMEADAFAAGTMFFVRRRNLDPMLALGLNRDDFEVEAGQRDGTMAHALERMFALAVLREGGRISDTDKIREGRVWTPGGEFPFAAKTDFLYVPGNGT